MLTDSAANAALDAAIPTGANNTQLSLHSAYSTSGGNLIGTRVNSNFAAASARTKSLAASVNFSVPAGTTVAWVGVWNAAGTTFLSTAPNGSTNPPKTFQVDLTNDRIICENHGFTNGQQVAFYGGAPPGGLTEGTAYFVVNVTAGDPDTFQVSTTSGGAAINLTAQHAASCVVNLIVPETYASAGTHTINVYTATL